jgi:para-nitrobenzyl esterase
LPDVPLNLISSGNFNKVPVIMGTNSNEGSIFVPPMALIIPGVHFPIQPSDYPLLVGHFYNNNQTIIAMVEQQYPLANYPNAETCFADLLRDFFFICASRRALEAMDANGATTWMYHWDYHGDWIEDKVLGDYHSAELEFVWDNQWPPIVHQFSQNDTTMSNTVDTYWSNFVFTLDPNSGEKTSRTGKLNDEEYWAPFDPVQQQDLVLAVPTRVEQLYTDSNCDMWDQVDQENRQPMRRSKRVHILTEN